MKNYEKYAEKIREYRGADFCGDFIVPHIVKSREQCSDTNCKACQMLCTIWLLEDYKEPEVDWNNVKVDTPILVRDNENAAWTKRHFAKYENGDIWAWRDAQTSWTASYADDMTWWRYAKLAESEEGGEE